MRRELVPSLLVRRLFPRESISHTVEEMRRRIELRPLVGQRRHGIRIDKINLVSTTPAGLENLAKHPVLEKIADVAAKYGHLNPEMLVRGAV
jgi:hypothetical protein